MKKILITFILSLVTLSHVCGEENTYTDLKALPESTVLAFEIPNGENIKHALHQTHEGKFFDIVSNNLNKTFYSLLILSNPDFFISQLKKQSIKDNKQPELLSSLLSNRAGFAIVAENTDQPVKDCQWVFLFWCSPDEQCASMIKQAFANKNVYFEKSERKKKLMLFAVSTEKVSKARVSSICNDFLDKVPAQPKEQDKSTIISGFINPRPLHSLLNNINKTTAEVITKLGLVDIEKITFHYEFEDHTIRGKAITKIQRPLRGIYPNCESWSISEEAPTWIPLDSVSYSKDYFDLASSYQHLKEVLFQVLEDSQVNILKTFELQFHLITKVQFSELLDSFGTDTFLLTHSINNRMDHTNLNANSLIITVKNKDVVTKCLEKGCEIQLFHKKTSEKNNISTYEIKNIHMPVYMSIVKDFLIISFDRNNLNTVIEGFLRSNESGNRFVDSLEYKKAIRLLDPKQAYGYSVMSTYNFTQSAVELIRRDLSLIESGKKPAPPWLKMLEPFLFELDNFKRGGVVVTKRYSTTEGQVHETVIELTPTKVLSQSQNSNF